MKAPSFSLKNQDGRTVSLRDFQGKTLVLYFYPKADTPGCTAQACAVRDNRSAFEKLGASVLGVSPDEVADIKKFDSKHRLGFTLLADPDTSVIKAYDVWKEKTFMGRRFMGVERSTFIIDGKGVIVKHFPKVNPITHADIILSELRSIKESSSSKEVKNLPARSSRSTKRPAGLGGAGTARRPVSKPKASKAKNQTKTASSAKNPAPKKKRSLKSRPSAKK